MSSASSSSTRWSLLATAGVTGVTLAAAATAYYLYSTPSTPTPTPTPRPLSSTPSPTIPSLTAYDVSPTRGFLRSSPPLRRLSLVPEWEEAVDLLPARLLADRHAAAMEELPVVDAVSLLGQASDAELERAFLVLGLLAHGYVFEPTQSPEGKPNPSLPQGIALPWAQVGAMLSRPPVLAHGSVALANYRELDSVSGPVLSNLAMNSLFLGSSDEAWFFTSTLGIEAAGGPGLAALVGAMQAVEENNAGMVESCLAAVEDAVIAMIAALDALPLRCLPVVFYHRIRPFLAGWKGNNDLPNGLEYRGVRADYDYATSDPSQIALAEGGDDAAFVGEYSGASAAQSSLIQALDAGLGIEHQSEFLTAMRDHMPRKHAAFIQALRDGPSIAEFVASSGLSSLHTRYDAVRTKLAAFRTRHIQIVTRYILQQTPKSDERGTGGTSILPFLQGIRDSTSPSS